MMKKVVFISSGAGNPNDIKRMEEFQAKGYDVYAYYFVRHQDELNHPKGIRTEPVGSFTSDSSFLSRYSIIKKGIQTVLNKHKDDDCLFYLFRNDMAIYFSFLSRKPYVFEEADMTHLNFSNVVLRRVLEKRIKHIVKKSVVSVFRSEGFVQCHFGDYKPDNVWVIPNRLHPDVLSLPAREHRRFDPKKIVVGFVGGIRYDSIYSFADFFLKNFPQHELHFYGYFTVEVTEKKFSALKKYPNCFFHGRFKSPDDLPDIYSKIDLLLSTYNVESINPRYAEPNKLYESIYFGVPIIVSSNSYIADKVSRLSIGYDVNAFDESDVVNLVRSLTPESVEQRRNNINKIDKMSCVNRNDDFFDFLDERIKKTRL